MDCLSHLASLGHLLVAGDRSQHGRIRLAGTPTGPVDILALGSGWTWSFVGPAAGERGLKTAFTTRDGRNGSIPFTFDPDSDDVSPFAALPDAQTVIIIFPLYSAQAARRLVHGYMSTRGDVQNTTWWDEKYSVNSATRFILLGSTGIWQQSGPTVLFAPLHANGPDAWHGSAESAAAPRATSTFAVAKHRKPSPTPSPWVSRHDKVDDVPRAQAENALLALNDKAPDDGGVPTSVLCLSGLWGHGRSPRRYVSAIAPTKERLARLTSVHLVHGHDVARALLAMHEQWDKTAGERWLLTNERVYDLWDLVSQWGNAGEAGRNHAPQGPQPTWVQELMLESRNTDGTSTRDPIRALPRTPQQLGFAMDGSDFWTTFGLHPDVAWVD